MKNNTNAIRMTIYPLVEKSLDGKGTRNFMKLISDFINARNEYLFNVLPIYRIAYTAEDISALFKALDIDIKIVKNALNNTYYADIKKYNFRIPQDPTTVLITCIVRYFLLKNDKKKLELASMYMAFSGKMYPSCHFKSFHYPPVDYVMEYVVHNKLDRKFDITSKGNIFNAIKSKCDAWMKKYAITKFKRFSDDDVVYVILQLRSRISAFMKKIATVYYDCYDKKEYLVYNSDSETPDNYHLASSDSFMANNAVNKTMEFISTSGVDYRICKLSSNKTVKCDELKNIMDAIFNTADNMPEIKDLISNIIYTYFMVSKEKNVVSIDFIAYTTTPKPNTKDEHILSIRDTVIKWLDTESVLFRKRKNRDESRNNYIKAVLMYISLAIYTANK